MILADRGCRHRTAPDERRTSLHVRPPVMNNPAKGRDVLVVSAWDPANLLDGGSLILHHHLRHLAADHDIRLIVAGGPHSTAVTEPATTVIPLDHPRTRAVASRLRSVWSGEPAHVHWVERRALVEAVTAAVERRRPDVVHLHGWGTAQLSRLVPGVHAVHMPIDSWELGAGNRIVPASRRLSDIGQLRRIAEHEARHYPRAGAVVFVANGDAEFARRRIPAASIHVVPNGVDPGTEPAPEAWSDHPAPILAFHGAFGTHANVDAANVLIREVLPIVRGRLPDARLLLIGMAPPMGLRELARANGVELRADVAAVRPELERAAIYVAPMVSGTGLKNKVLEAMAAGLPVVATALGLDGIGEGPGTVHAEEPREIAKSVIALLEEAGGCRREGQMGRARVVAGFGWDRSADRIRALWRRDPLPSS